VEAPTPLLLWPYHRDEIIAHAHAEAPRECCGLVEGVGGKSKRIWKLTNAAHSKVTFELDPEEQLEAMGEIKRAGHELIATYHSHPQSAAYPSEIDEAKLAAYPEVRHLIVSLAGPEPDLRAYWIRKSSSVLADEVPLAVVQ